MSAFNAVARKSLVLKEGFMQSAGELERIMKRYEVLRKAIQGELTWIQAAEVLGLSARQVRRIRKRFENQGIESLMDHRHGGPAWNRRSDELRDKVIRLYRDEYFDYNVKHFHEKLQKEHGLKECYLWVLKVLQEAKLVQKYAKKDAHRKKRERRPLEGMMIHLDGSDHQWIKTHQERWDLLATLDDATNEVYECIIVPEESTRSVFQVLRSTIEKKGVFCSLYTDRGSHFACTEKMNEKSNRLIRTQCQRALDQLGIRLILANSPQARGRGERLWKTFQGRIPQEFRRAGINEIEQANQYLKEIFIPDYNERFKVISKEQGSAFVPLMPSMDLSLVFSIQTERIVNNDNTVSYKKKLLQLDPSTLRYSFSRCRVLVYEHLDGSLSIGYGPHIVGRFKSTGEPFQDLSKLIAAA